MEDRIRSTSPVPVPLSPSRLTQPEPLSQSTPPIDRVWHPAISSPGGDSVPSEALGSQHWPPDVNSGSGYPPASNAVGSTDPDEPLNPLGSLGIAAATRLAVERMTAAFTAVAGGQNPLSPTESPRAYDPTVNDSGQHGHASNGRATADRLIVRDEEVGGEVIREPMSPAGKYSSSPRAVFSGDSADQVFPVPAIDRSISPATTVQLPVGCGVQMEPQQKQSLTPQQDRSPSPCAEQLPSISAADAGRSLLNSFDGASPQQSGVLSYAGGSLSSPLAEPLSPLSPSAPHSSSSPGRGHPSDCDVPDAAVPVLRSSGFTGSSGKDHLRTSFAKTLSATTVQAPGRLAEKLIDRLQQVCLDEAAAGNSSAVSDMSLPLSRHFSDAVARAFASQLKELGFQSFEWWNGKDWKVMPGRYVILHDTKYDRYSMRVRVHWSEDLTPEELVELGELVNRGAVGKQAVMHDDSALQPVVQQLQQVLSLQQDLIVRSAAAQAAAEERAEQAEARALAAERACLEALQASRPQCVVEVSSDLAAATPPRPSSPVAEKSLDAALFAEESRIEI